MVLFNIGMGILVLELIYCVVYPTAYRFIKGEIPPCPLGALYVVMGVGAGISLLGTFVGGH